MSLLSMRAGRFRLTTFTRSWLVAAASVALMAAACGDDSSEKETNSGAGASSSTSTNSSSNSGSQASSGNGGAAATSGTGANGVGGGSVLVGDLSDDFEGDGPLVDYTTNNPNALPGVMRVNGRYHANLVDNTDDITLHYNNDQGRLDAKLIAFPFEVVVRNIGIGTQADSQTAPDPSGFLYIFAGVQVHVPDLNARDSSHVVVGHRGDQYFTVEGKNTVNGDSSVNDAGGYIVPDGRADIRIVGTANHTLEVYWQTPNPAPGSQADSWTPYNGTGQLPGEAPNYGDNVYVGLITYAFGYNGIPFVGTADSVEGGSQ